MTALYHLLLILADLGALLAVGRVAAIRPGRPEDRRADRTWLTPLVGFVWLVVAWSLARNLPPAFGHGWFATMRLLAGGVFVHLPLLLVLVARRLRHRILSASTLIGAGVLLAIAVDAFAIEPHWLEVSWLSVRSAKLRQPVRLVVLADFQTDTFGGYEREIFRRALAEKPDLILLPGDYLQEEDDAKRSRLGTEVNAYLRAIGFGAPDGTLAVRGDVDGPGWERLFAGLPVTAFQRTRTVRRAGLAITALTPEDSRDPKLRVPSQDRFHVVFGHSPEFALLGLDADLLLAGHTHGGQVRLPGIGPLMTLSRVPRSWAAGRTELPGGGTLVVSRGLGMERGQAPRLRFFCRPEIVVIDLLADLLVE